MYIGCAIGVEYTREEQDRLETTLSVLNELNEGFSKIGSIAADEYADTVSDAAMVIEKILAGKYLD